MAQLMPKSAIACCFVSFFVEGISGLHVSVAELASNKTAHQDKKVGLHYLRIQKTGSTTFGDVIMREFCGKGSDDCRGGMHTDWSQATENGHYAGPVVTLLRDPVERTLSEFFWLRSPDGLICASAPFWDFRNDTWLRVVQHEPNTTRALEAYLRHYRKNPSRNRQTLYILGFRDGKEGSLGYNVKNPGATYNWDDRPGMLLRFAMQKLDNLTAFGITECWASSMRAIARAVGWNVSAVEALAASAHERKFSKDGLAKRDAFLAKNTKDALITSPWSKLVPKKYVEEIVKWNNVDMRLYKDAKKRFSEKFGEPCP